MYIFNVMFSVITFNYWYFFAIIKSFGVCFVEEDNKFTSCSDINTTVRYLNIGSIT